MTRAVDVEALRQIFTDSRVHIAMALVEKTEILLDFSKVKAQLKVFPEENEIVAEVAWGATGPNAGDIQVPQPKDLVLVAYADSGEAFVIARLSSAEDKVPRWADGGHRVVQALAGKNLFLGGPGGVFLGAGGAGWAATPPDEPLVLGNVLAAHLNALTETVKTLTQKVSAIVDKITAGPVAISGSPGAPAATYPQLVTDLTVLKTDVEALQIDLDDQVAQFLDDDSSNILSGIAFTER